MTLRLALALMLLTGTVATATSIDFANQGGVLTGGNSGLTMVGSTLVAVSPTPFIAGNLGTVEFSTGALASGTTDMGGTFNAGGMFTITSNGTGGLHGGVIFTGTFDSPVMWTLITLANGTHNYTLTGTLTGTWYTGTSVNGVTVQLTINTGKGFFNGSTLISSGNTEINGVGIREVVPEPGTLSMLGTGLLLIGAKIRQKLVN